MSNFTFLQAEFPAVFEAARQAEAHAHGDPRAACFYVRRALELALAWLYRHDPALRLPYQDHLAALIHEPTFQQTAGPVVVTKARLIKELGNLAVHGNKPLRVSDALSAVRELFHIGYWLARSYGRSARPAPDLAFDVLLLPAAVAAARPQTGEQLARLEAQLRERDQALAALATERTTLDDELARLRAEIAQARAANTAQADTHDYSEALTRSAYIDVLLHEAGWPLDQPRDREFEVTGMPNTQGTGYVDYVLWGDDAKPLALVEAKRTTRDARVGQQQAKLYADCLEKAFGQRPLIFCSNGYEHWLWDDTRHPPRPVQGFYKKAELELAIQRRSSRKPLADAEIDPAIVERYYQTRAIRRIGETFEVDGQRRALVVMATGAGKTRTVIALVDLLMRCNWVKRALFLADRVALVNQAAKSFKKFLPGASPVNLVTEKDTDGRVFVSTYPTMMGLIEEMRGGERRFGVGHFDLIVIDEAHRSVYQKYGAIFEYFDAAVVGLTATPRDEVSRDTYRLFNLERGVPTDAYALEDAVRDGYLVPAKAISVPLRIQRQGIRYAELSDEERDQWDGLPWDDETSEVPEEVNAEAVNQWLFNADTVDKVLEHLMAHGLKVAGGERLGKTIVFAKNNAHAEFIAARFNVHYPHLKGEFARVITFKTEYAQSLIDAFSDASKAPHIAISVDMLDTGIDVPEVLNLVFFKLVRSKTKFWQMVGRGTRLSEHLFGPGEHKREFLIFDFCQNLEFFEQELPASEGAVGESLGARLFKGRLELLMALDASEPEVLQVAQPPSPWQGHDAAAVRRDTAELLRTQVAAMNVDNFLVRPRRRLVETWRDAPAWNALTPEAVAALADPHTGLASLPSELPAEDEEAKRFDLLMLRTQLAVLHAERGFARLRQQVQQIAGLLAEQAAIPMVKREMLLIEAMQGDEWWQDVTVPMLEVARRRLRALIKLIERRARKVVYSDFEDEIGEAREIALSGVAPVGTDFERFRAKARSFLRAHQDRLALQKLRRNQALTVTDLEELERLLLEAGGSLADIEAARSEGAGLGLFVRSLVGLDRVAAKELFNELLAHGTASANQIEFLNLLIEHLTEQGVMAASRLYESPFTDLTPAGPEALFSPVQIDCIIAVLNDVRAKAA
ncbi:MAG: DEAD/DEAH box helicase family protein [Pseudomonadota bacterium]